MAEDAAPATTSGVGRARPLGTAGGQRRAGVLQPVLAGLGLLEDPVMVQLCMGIPWGAPDDLNTFMALRNNVPDHWTFSAFSLGRNQMRYVNLAALAGGNVRVGLEDNLYLEKGVLASNAQLVDRARTIVEAMVQESHSEDNPPWLDTHFHAWSRFVCREGENRFETFDYESLRLLQIHVREADGPVMVRDVGVRRRSYDWPRPPHFRCDEPGLQRVFEALFLEAALRHVQQGLRVVGVAGGARNGQAGRARTELFIGYRPDLQL